MEGGYAHSVKGERIEITVVDLIVPAAILIVRIDLRLGLRLRLGKQWRRRQYGCLSWLHMVVMD